jgi:hypothetical protein
VRGVICVLGGGGGGCVPFTCEALSGLMKGQLEGRANFLMCRRESRHFCIILFILG